jgi:LacI family transcriptional regulator
VAEVGLKEVAALAGVSMSTVSNALNRPWRVSATSAARVEEAIQRLGYVPNQAARQLRAGRSRTIGLAVINITNPFFSEMVVGAEEVATEAGYAVIVGNSYDSADKELLYLDLFERQRCDGILLAPVGGNLDRLDRLRRQGIPTVLVDRVDEGGTLLSVSLDDVEGGRLAGEHLLSVGCRRITFVGGPFGVPQMRNRRDGCHAAISESSTATMTVIPTETLNVGLGRRIADDILAMPESERPDGIFAANDVLGLGILQGFIRHGVRVPEDIAIVGYDNIDFAESAAVPLTSIEQPSREMGREAARKLIAQLEHDDEAAEPGTSEVFSPVLIARESTRRIDTAA